MSQPKNTTGSEAAQCPLEKFTVHHCEFWEGGSRRIFQLCPEITAGEALTESSSFMSVALALADRLGDDSESADRSLLFAIRFILEGSKALLDGGTYGVKYKHVHGGAK